MDNPFFRALEPFPEGHKTSLGEALDHIMFNEQGLITAVAQQHDTGEVLMVAWMNREAILATLEEQYVCYWSRSRKELWRKGETSGHRQRLMEMRLDCDGDAILCLVDQTGPACHTNRRNCFYLSVQDDQLNIIADMPTPSES